MYDSSVNTRAKNFKFTGEEVEMEGYKGKHGQSDKEYAASRSQGGKMISGDDKMSGAEYTHGRRVKAANPGMQPDVGGKTKPKSQGKMDKGSKADLMYRKAALKKEELEATGKFTAEEIEAILAQDIEEGKVGAAAGGAVGDVVGRTAGMIAGAKLGGKLGGYGGAALGAKIGAVGGGAAGAATGAAVGAKKGRKKDAALGGAVGSIAGPVGSGIGGAIASSYEPEGNPIHEVFKDDIEQFAVNEIAGALTSLAKGARDLGSKFGPGGLKAANKVIDTTKSGIELAKKHPVRTAAIGTGVAGAGILAANSGKKND